MILFDGGYVGLAPVPGAPRERRDRAWRLVAGRACGATGRRRRSRPCWRRSRGPTTTRSTGARAERCDPIEGAAPLGVRAARRAGDGWLLVGDAAGFLDPFTGEGLHRALVSARLAAAAVDRALDGDATALGGLRPSDDRPVPLEGRAQPPGPGVPRPARPLRATPPAGSPPATGSVRRWASSWETSCPRPVPSTRGTSPRSSGRRVATADRPRRPGRRGAATTGPNLTRLGSYALCLDEDEPDPARAPVGRRGRRRCVDDAGRRPQLRRAPGRRLSPRARGGDRPHRARSRAWPACSRTSTRVAVRARRATSTSSASSTASGSTGGGLRDEIRRHDRHRGLDRPGRVAGPAPRRARQVRLQPRLPGLRAVRSTLERRRRGAAGARVPARPRRRALAAAAPPLRRGAAARPRRRRRGRRPDGRAAPARARARPRICPSRGGRGRGATSRRSACASSTRAARRTAWT